LLEQVDLNVELEKVDPAATRSYNDALDQALGDTAPPTPVLALITSFLPHSVSKDALSKATQEVIRTMPIGHWMEVAMYDWRWARMEVGEVAPDLRMEVVERVEKRLLLPANSIRSSPAEEVVDTAVMELII